MTVRRTVLLRSLPFLLLALAIELRSPAPPQPAVACTAVESAPAPADTDERAAAADPLADRTTVLSAQFTAGTRGCRAPPAAFL